MILIHHFITHCFFSTSVIFGNSGGISSVEGFAIILNAFCYIGVNCFILISGYFGIKPKVWSFVALYFTCIFYSIIQHFIEIQILETRVFSIGVIKDLILVFSQNDYWWFINCYVILFLLSPIINKGIDSFNKKEFTYTLLSLTIANVYFGFWWGRYNPSGYSVAQFVYIYVLGRYLNKFMPSILTSRKKCAIIYCMCSILFGTFSILSHYMPMEVIHWRSIPYNNPILIAASVAFFCFMLTFNIESKTINRIAQSSIAVYLLQNIPFMKTLVSEDSVIGGLIIGKHIPHFIGLLIGLTMIYALTALLIDQIRIALLQGFRYIYSCTFSNMKMT